MQSALLLLAITLSLIKLALDLVSLKTFLDYKRLPYVLDVIYLLCHIFIC